MNKDKLKEYAVSSALTFTTSMAIVLLADIDKLTLDSFKDGTIVGLAFVAVRAGVKGLLQYYLSTRN